LHNVLSFPHISLSYPKENPQPVQNVLVVLCTDTFTSNTILRCCDSRHSILYIFTLRLSIYLRVLEH
jgi:hypothetical protein